jgi:hypothetical protein
MELREVVAVAADLFEEYFDGFENHPSRRVIVDGTAFLDCSRLSVVISDSNA